MRNRLALVLAVAGAIFSASASAQILPQLPDLQSRIPAPLPPPAVPPVINGPMMQSAPLGLIAPAPLTTFSDRVGPCIQAGGGAGLSGSDLNAYIGACANAN
jgi:hypothetical protein